MVLKHIENNLENIFLENDAPFYIDNINNIFYYKFKLICKFINVNNLNKYKLNITNNTSYVIHIFLFGGSTSKIILFENIALKNIIK